MIVSGIKDKNQEWQCLTMIRRRKKDKYIYE